MKIQEDYFYRWIPHFQEYILQLRENINKNLKRSSKSAAEEAAEKQDIYESTHKYGFMFLTSGSQARNYWLLRNIYNLIKRKAHLTIKALPENAGAMG